MESIRRPSPRLRETQQSMALLILHPERLEHEMPGWAAAPPRGNRRERLDVYVNGYAARVQDAIEESYPAVTHVIGHRAAHAMVSRYLSALTRHSYNLNDVAAELPRFLRGDELAARFPFLADLAQLEWAIARAFHAYDKPALDPRPLAKWTAEQWEHAVLAFQPSVTVLCSPWPIHELWEARATPIEAIDIDLRDRPDQVIVYRAGFDIHCTSIRSDEASVLGTLLAGHTLGEVSELLGANGGDPTAVSTWFGGWMQRRLIVSCERRTPQPE